MLVLILSTTLVFPAVKSVKADPYPDFYAEDRAQSEHGSFSEEKFVCLSFDDGPSSCTDKILDILAEKEVPATFFVIGPEGELTDERILRILKEGHEIGLHSFCHDYGKIYSSADSFLCDLNEEQSWISSVTGEKCSVFRFPGGSANSHADKGTIKAIKKEMIGYVSIVLVFVVISALALFADDFIIARILNALEKALKPAETTPTEEAVNVLLNIGRMFK